MARCRECIHYEVCAKEGRMVQVDEHTWDDYNQLDNVECFCENYISTADVAPRAEWISVEERLPDGNGVFLVSLKESGYENLVYFDVIPYADGEWRNLPDKFTVSIGCH